MRLENVVDLLAIGVGGLRPATEPALLPLLRDADLAGGRATVRATIASRRGAPATGTTAVIATLASTATAVPAVCPTAEPPAITVTRR